MKKKYFFLIKRSNDLDHCLPIIYALLKKGVSKSKIFVTDIEYNHSNFNLSQNKLYKYLLSQNIKTNFLISKICSFFFEKIIFGENLYFNENLKKNNLFKNYTILLFKQFIQILFVIKIIFYSINKNKIYFIFKYNNFAIKVLNKLNSNKNSILNLPHGFPLWDGPDEFLSEAHNSKIFLNHPLVNTIFFEGKQNYEWFYFLKFNYKTKFNKKLFYDQFKIFPLRYTQDWIKILQHKILKLNKNYISKKKEGNFKNILFFPSKLHSHIENKIFDENLQKEAIFYILEKYKDVTLNIRFHPSQFKNLKLYQEFKDFKNCKFHLGEKISTLELVLENDIILGVYTSALLDAIALNKKIIILKHCSNVIPSININNTENHQDFKNIFDKLMNNTPNKEEYFNTYNNLIHPQEYRDGDIFEMYLKQLSL